MQVSVLQQHCANHGERPASARCVECRRSICQECATHWDGINYCVSCLGARGRAARRSSRLPSWVLLLFAVPFFFWLAVCAMLWIGGLMAGLA